MKRIEELRQIINLQNQAIDLCHVEMEVILDRMSKARNTIAECKAEIWEIEYSDNASAAA